MIGDGINNFGSSPTGRPDPTGLSSAPLGNKEEVQSSDDILLCLLGSELDETNAANEKALCLWDVDLPQSDGVNFSKGPKGFSFKELKSVFQKFPGLEALFHNSVDASNFVLFNKKEGTCRRLQAEGEEGTPPPMSFTLITLSENGEIQTEEIRDVKVLYFTASQEARIRGLFQKAMEQLQEEQKKAKEKAKEQEEEARAIRKNFLDSRVSRVDKKELGEDKEIEKISDFSSKKLRQIDAAREKLEEEKGLLEGRIRKQQVQDKLDRWQERRDEILRHEEDKKEVAAFNNRPIY